MDKRSAIHQRSPPRETGPRFLPQHAPHTDQPASSSPPGRSCPNPKHGGEARRDRTVDIGNPGHIDGSLNAPAASRRKQYGVAIRVAVPAPTRGSMSLHVSANSIPIRPRSASFSKHRSDRAATQPPEPGMEPQIGPDGESRGWLRGVRRTNKERYYIPARQGFSSAPNRFGAGTRRGPRLIGGAA